MSCISRISKANVAGGRGQGTEGRDALPRDPGICVGRVLRDPAIGGRDALLRDPGWHVR